MISKRTLAVVACLAATAVLPSCGGDDGPDLPPKPSATDEVTSSTDAPTPSGSAPTPTSPATSSAPPGGADLDRAQRSAYTKAVRDLDAADALIDSLNANPQPNQQTADKIKSVSYDPFSGGAFVEIQRFKKAGVRVEGSREVVWNRPVEVSLGGTRPKVVLESCTTSGTLRVLKGSREIPQDKTPTIGRITMYASESGRWMLTETKVVGKCG